MCRGLNSHKHILFLILCGIIYDSSKDYLPRVAFFLLKTLDYYVQIAKTNDKCVFDRSHFKIYVIFL